MMTAEPFAPATNVSVELSSKISSFEEAPPKTVSGPVVPTIVLLDDAFPMNRLDDEPRKYSPACAPKIVSGPVPPATVSFYGAVAETSTLPEPPKIRPPLPYVATVLLPAPAIIVSWPYDRPRVRASECIQEYDVMAAATCYRPAAIRKECVVPISDCHVVRGARHQTQQVVSIAGCNQIEPATGGVV